MTDVWEIETPVGLARAHVHPVPRGRPKASLVLGHGAGGGVDAADLAAIAAALPAEGVEIVLVEQPWRVAGRRVAGAPSTLDRAWVACVAQLRTRGIGARRLVVGGRSSGARVACRTVGEVQPAALLLLAFPLHPPGQGGAEGRTRSRLPELLAAARVVRTAVVQGTRDSFGTPADISNGLVSAAVTAEVVPILGGDHSFRVLAQASTTTAAALEQVVAAARSTVGLVVGPAER